jgi:hypothetical protein
MRDCLGVLQVADIISVGYWQNAPFSVDFAPNPQFHKIFLKSNNSYLSIFVFQRFSSSFRCGSLKLSFQTGYHGHIEGKSPWTKTHSIEEVGHETIQSCKDLD